MVYLFWVPVPVEQPENTALGSFPRVERGFTRPPLPQVAAQRSQDKLCYKDCGGRTLKFELKEIHIPGASNLFQFGFERKTWSKQGLCLPPMGLPICLALCLEGGYVNKSPSFLGRFLLGELIQPSGEITGEWGPHFP